jgi:hypothetical protein
LRLVPVTNNALVSAALGYVEANPAELDAVRDLVILSLLGPRITLCDTQVNGPVPPGWRLPGGHVAEEGSSLLGSTLRQPALR